MAEEKGDDLKELCLRYLLPYLRIRRGKSGKICPCDRCKPSKYNRNCINYLPSGKYLEDDGYGDSDD